MKQIFILFALIASFAFAKSNYTEEQLLEISERLKPVGKVCLSTDACAEKLQPKQASTASNGVKNASDTIKTYCSTCHETGLLDAPKIGDSEAWKARLAAKASFKDLIASAVAGVGGMPAKGMCSDCSNEDLAAAVNEMAGFKLGTLEEEKEIKEENQELQTTDKE